MNDGAQTISEYTTPVLHQADIGTVGTPGTFAESGGIVTMTASGDDIWNTADNFTYAYRQLTGDGSITALLISETATSSYTKAGVMIRDSLDPGAAEACMEYQYSESYPVFQYRDSDGAGTAQTSASSTWPTPIWLRLVRSGFTFYSYCSSDGVTWVSAGSQNISMGSTVYIGLALCAHDASADTTGIFENISTTGNVTSVDSPTLTNEYVYGSYIDEPLALIQGSNTYFYADNRVYSVAALTDSSGLVKERYRYDSYGNRTVMLADDSAPKTTGLIGNQRGFTGYYLDQESGLNYARARMYSPALGRFIGRDAAYHNGLNFYESYFIPNGLDPLGTNCCCKTTDDCYLEYSPQVGAKMNIYGYYILNSNKNSGAQGVGFAQTFTYSYSVTLKSKHPGKGTCGCHIYQSMKAIENVVNQADAVAMLPGDMKVPPSAQFSSSVSGNTITTQDPLDIRTPNYTHCVGSPSNAQISDSPEIPRSSNYSKKGMYSSISFHGVDWVAEAPSIQGTIDLSATFDWGTTPSYTWKVDSSDPGIHADGE